MRIQRITFDGVSVPVPNRFTVLCGRNGVGKSRVLATVRQAHHRVHASCAGPFDKIDLEFAYSNRPARMAEFTIGNEPNVTRGMREFLKGVLFVDECSTSPSIPWNDWLHRDDFADAVGDVLGRDDVANIVRRGPGAVLTRAWSRGEIVVMETLAPLFREVDGVRLRPSMMVIDDLGAFLDPWTCEGLVAHLHGAADRGVQILAATNSPWILDECAMDEIVQGRRASTGIVFEVFKDRPEVRAYDAAGIPPGTRFVNELE